VLGYNPTTQFCSGVRYLEITNETRLSALLPQTNDQRQISVNEVSDVVEMGELIERYQADEPARYLMLGWSGKRPLHVVAEDDPVSGETIVVTAYEPDRRVWKAGFKERKGTRK